MCAQRDTLRGRDVFNAVRLQFSLSFHQQRRWRPLWALLLPAIVALTPTTAAALTPAEVASTRVVAARGEATAQVLLAIAYLSGDGGLPADPQMAAHWFEMAALQGAGYAESRLADLYEAGVGVARNLTLAADWRERAARRGNTAAQTKLGSMYQRGDGVVRDTARARMWLQLAAEAGDDDAVRRLAKIDAEHAVVGHDVVLARPVMGEFAARRYEEARHLLARIAPAGGGTDRALTRSRLEQLAVDGDLAAQTRLLQAPTGVWRGDALVATPAHRAARRTGFGGGIWSASLSFAAVTDLRLAHFK